MKNNDVRFFVLVGLFGIAVLIAISELAYQVGYKNGWEDANVDVARKIMLAFSDNMTYHYFEYAYENYTIPTQFCSNYINENGKAIGIVRVAVDDNVTQNTDLILTKMPEV